MNLIKSMTMVFSMFIATGLAQASTIDFSSGIDCWTLRDNLKIEKIDLANKTAQISLAIQSHVTLYQSFLSTLVDGGRFLKLDLVGERGFVLIDTSELDSSLNLNKKMLNWSGQD